MSVNTFNHTVSYISVLQNGTYNPITGGCTTTYTASFSVGSQGAYAARSVCYNDTTINKEFSYINGITVPQNVITTSVSGPYTRINNDHGEAGGYSSVTVDGTFYDLNSPGTWVNVPGGYYIQYNAAAQNFLGLTVSSWAQSETRYTISYTYKSY